MIYLLRGGERWRGPHMLLETYREGLLPVPPVPPPLEERPNDVRRTVVVVFAPVVDWEGFREDTKVDLSGSGVLDAGSPGIPVLDIPTPLLRREEALIPPLLPADVDLLTVEEWERDFPSLDSVESLVVLGIDGCAPSISSEAIIWLTLNGLTPPPMDGLWP
jgi:hypothetical protein